MNTYDRADTVRLTATFTLDDVVSDPGGVVFKVKDPDGNVATYTYGVDAAVVKDSTGVYYVDYEVAGLVGPYYYRMEGTAPVRAACEGAFAVRQSLVLD